MRRLVLLLALVAVLNPASAFAWQEESPVCPEFEGVVCDGWVTDAAGVIIDDAHLEEVVTDFVRSRGHQTAVVVIPTSGSLSPYEFAIGIGNKWGVGDSVANDGLVILVALAERRTEIVTGDGLTGFDAQLEAAAESADDYFAAGDFDGGIEAIIESLGKVFPPAGTDTASITTTVATATTDEELKPTFSSPESDGGSNTAVVVAIVFGGIVALAGGGAIAASRRAAARRDRDERALKVDAELATLEPTGQELPLIEEYSVQAKRTSLDVPTVDATSVLGNLIERHTGGDTKTLGALWYGGAVAVLIQDTRYCILAMRNPHFGRIV